MSPTFVDVVESYNDFVRSIGMETGVIIKCKKCKKLFAEKDIQKVVHGSGKAPFCSDECCLSKV